MLHAPCIYCSHFCMIGTSKIKWISDHNHLEYSPDGEHNKANVCCQSNTDGNDECVERVIQVTA